MKLSSMKIKKNVVIPVVPMDEVLKLHLLMAQMDKKRKETTDTKLQENIRRNDTIWNGRR